MVSHLKGVKKSTLTDEMRRALCEYKTKHPSSNQKDLQQWVQQSFISPSANQQYQTLLKGQQNICQMK